MIIAKPACQWHKTPCTSPNKNPDYPVTLISAAFSWYHCILESDSDNFSASWVNLRYQRDGPSELGALRSSSCWCLFYTALHLLICATSTLRHAFFSALHLLLCVRHLLCVTPSTLRAGFWAPFGAVWGVNEWHLEWLLQCLEEKGSHVQCLQHGVALAITTTFRSPQWLVHVLDGY